MSQLLNDSAWAIAQRFPAVPPSERDQILRWARETSLVYGAWKSFKKLFKTLDEAARAGQTFDIELLGVCLARIDRHVVAASTPRLVANSEAADIVGNGKEARSATHLFRVGGRAAYDSYGWRLVISALENPPQTLLQTVSQKLKIGGAPATNTHKSWDFNARDYVSSLKKAELKGTILTVTTQYRDSRQVDVADSNFLYLVGSGPTRETWTYLKRRARRLLRSLQTRDEYWPLLLAMLRASGPEPLNTAWQWATIDALFGGGPRIKQRGHGRSTVEIDRTFWNRRREERAGAAWDAHRDEVRALVGDETVAVAANAVAFNVLRATEEAQLLAAISPRQLERFLGGEVRWLCSLAAREALRRWQNGVSPSGAIAAQLAVLSGATTRRAARELLAAMPLADSAWQTSFAAPLLDFLVRAARLPENASMQSRACEAARLLATRAREGIGDDAFWLHLNRWLALEAELGQEFSRWIEARLIAAGKAGKTEHLAAIAQLESAARERALQMFLREAGKQKPGKDTAIALVTTGEISLNRVGWRYLAASAITESDLLAVWRHFFNRYLSDEDFSAAFSDDTVPLFQRIAWKQQVAGFWGEEKTPLYAQAWSRIMPRVSAGFFRALVALSQPLEVAPRVFKALSFLRPATQSAVIEEFLPAARDFAPSEEDIRAALIASHYYVQRQDNTAALRFLAASCVSGETVRAVWKELFVLSFAPDAASAAIELMRRAELSSDEVGAWLRENFGRIEQFPPDFLAALLRRSPSALLDGMLRAGEAQLPALRVLLHEQLRDAAFCASFWNALWPLLRDETQRETIQKNLLFDSEIARSFIKLEEVGEFFATDEEAHEALLLSWLDAHLAQLQRSDNTLLLAATCPLSNVHHRALDQVRAVGLDLPLALRLLESKLPPAMKLARDWFENSSPENETDRALALADSPSLDVQQIGREFILARRARLLSGETLKRLAENTSAPMQAWVAAQLHETNEVSTVEFDRTVLRARGRNRKAKELVKARLDVSSVEVAPATLLELARGRTTRDREWALQQLAKQALAGETIEGVELK